MSAAHRPNTVADDDPTHLWLEEVEGDRALAWVRAQNERTIAALDDPLLRALEERLLAVYVTDARIPYVTQRGEWYYNFWQDRTHPRGLWRRTTWTEYLREDPAWEVLVDVDALGQAEGESWVWKAAHVRRPRFDRALIELSRGGSDASVVREFDLEALQFVADGFAVPEGKTDVSWIDADTLFVGSDFGPGTTTASGYPRQVRRWARGTPLAAAPVVFEGAETDVSVWAAHDDTPGFERSFVGRALTFFTSEQFEETDSGALVRLDKPEDAEVAVVREWLLFHLRSAWTVGDVTHPAGALLVARYADWTAGDRRLVPLFTPTARTSLEAWTATRSHLLLTILEDVRTRIEILTPTADGWSRAPLPGVPEHGATSVSPLDAHDSDDYWLTSAGFLAPSALARGTVGAGPAAVVKRLPPLFAADGLAVTQRFARSADGTEVPYFLVGPEGGTDGDAPTLLTGYGGFEVSLRPFYAGGLGAAWIERGGVLAVANIRGGGEYGPAWHQAALREHRPRAYEDFAAVAADLVARGVTRPERLGAMGGSNGGLLVGNMLVHYPERFGAIVCQVPLLDMRRYHKLLAGASWMAEYGDPDDPDQWSFIRGFSPYHQVAAGRRYPPTLFVTSTRDDRVHPGHARKMAARMSEHGHELLYYENIEGGHGAAADLKQQARLDALTYRFLWKILGQG